MGGTSEMNSGGQVNKVGQREGYLPQGPELGSQGGVRACSEECATSTSIERGDRKQFCKGRWRQ